MDRIIDEAVCVYFENFDLSQLLSLGNLLILLVTLVVLIFYTKYTRDLLREARISNMINQQPLLDFRMEFNQPFKIENVGSGPALNIILMQRIDINTGCNSIYITPETNVLSAIPVGKIGTIKQSSLVLANTKNIKEQMPFASGLINEISLKRNNWICLIYEDVFRNKFASILNGNGSNYDVVIEFKKIV